MAQPSWASLLNYEFHVREHAVRALNDGDKTSLKDALAAARADSELRELHFTIQMAIGAAKAPPVVLEPARVSLLSHAAVRICFVHLRGPLPSLYPLPSTKGPLTFSFSFSFSSRTPRSGSVLST